MWKRTLIAVLLIALQPASGVLAQPTGPDPINGADEASFLRAALPLDEPRHLCVDTRGFGDTPKTDESLWVHTCKDGMWNLDMRFESSAAGTEIIMPQYGLCLVALEPEAGTEIWLQACGTDAAKWVWESSRLKYDLASSLCLTIVEGRSEMTPGGSKFPPKYRWRGLSLEACSDAAIERQLWALTKPLDVTTPILPPAGSLID
ncbi:MAG: RICIN domain-containing protein [Pseudomonadota bacterium]